MQVSSKVFKRLNPEGPGKPLVWVIMPALGGLCTGIVALAFPEILYQGFGNVNALLELKSADYAPLLLLQMLGAKVVVTAICRGSGLVGGIYAPSIFMGAPSKLPCSLSGRSHSPSPSDQGRTLGICSPGMPFSSDAGLPRGICACRA
jgi:hypothetical protein